MYGYPPMGPGMNSGGYGGYPSSGPRSEEQEKAFQKLMFKQRARALTQRAQSLRTEMAQTQERLSRYQRGEWGASYPQSKTTPDPNRPTGWYIIHQGPSEQEILTQRLQNYQEQLNQIDADWFALQEEARRAGFNPNEIVGQ